MCVSVSSVGLLLIVSQAKRHPKNEMQIKPIDGTKIFNGRVAPPPYGDALLGVYPTSKFFLNFFCSNSFSNFFSDFCFIC